MLTLFIEQIMLDNVSIVNIEHHSLCFEYLFISKILQLFEEEGNYLKFFTVWV